MHACMFVCLVCMPCTRMHAWVACTRSSIQGLLNAAWFSELMSLLLDAWGAQNWRDMYRFGVHPWGHRAVPPKEGPPDGSKFAVKLSLDTGPTFGEFSSLDECWGLIVLPRTLATLFTLMPNLPVSLLVWQPWRGECWNLALHLRLFRSLPEGEQTWSYRDPVRLQAHSKCSCEILPLKLS